MFLFLVASAFAFPDLPYSPAGDLGRNGSGCGDEDPLLLGAVVLFVFLLVAVTVVSSFRDRRPPPRD